MEILSVAVRNRNLRVKSAQQPSIYEQMYYFQGPSDVLMVRKICELFTFGLCLVYLNQESAIK